jgi:IS4 transposase
VISTGKVHDVTVAKTLKFQPDTIVVDDRGYNDYELFGRWTASGVYFVTRLKDNALYRVVRNLSIPESKQVCIKQDQLIRLTGVNAEKVCPNKLRLVSFYDEEQGQEFRFLTNNFRLAASTIAAIYKDRWAVELFFKALKQNLKIKTFVGINPSAVKTQVWTALIAMLMLRFMQLKAQWGWSLSNLVALLRMNLFTHRDLWAWLDKPFAVPPDPGGPVQVALEF